ncbi:hypothetical protein [Campylobacter concisus]|jgi:hypothetical protein|uniref:Uncharacterized protein n=1 Tax=Campylobacter concisus TaxID=199 RepID=A0A2R4P314_9BACT|nr:hypothetical protein [Campylobacter concisus]AVX45066.1 hypothetical protein CCS77_2060 [Campylobacter concisus]
MQTLTEKLERLNDLLERKFSENHVIGVNYITKAICNLASNNEVEIDIKTINNLLVVYFDGVKVFILRLTKKRILETLSIVKVELIDIKLSNVNVDTPLERVFEYTKNISKKRETGSSVELDNFLNFIREKFAINAFDLQVIISEYENLSYLAKEKLKQLNTIGHSK